MPTVGNTNTPPWGGHQGAVEEHGQAAGNGGAHDAGGDHAEGIACGVGDRALGDEAQTHDIVHEAVVALFRGPPPGEEGGGQGVDYR